MKKALVSTLVHVLELAVVVGVSLAVVRWLNIDAATYQALIVIVLAAITKFARASDLPVGDYVNNR